MSQISAGFHHAMLASLAPWLWYFARGSEYHRKARCAEEVPIVHCNLQSCDKGNHT